MDKKLTNLAKDWTQVPFLANSQSNHYTQMFSVLGRDRKWILIHIWMILSNLSISSI